MGAHKLLFLWYDYLILCLLLTISAIIGIRFGIFGSKPKTSEEYFLGGRNMGVIPTVLSLVASHISSGTLILIPTEIYTFGAMYWWCAIGLSCLGFITAEVFLPVIYDLKVVSSYEYLERRFDSRCRKLASLLFLLSILSTQPTTIYTPALALSAASGVSIYLLVPFVCGICICYTAIGGLKAVIWTDTIQLIFCYTTYITILVLGINAVGGLGTIWDKALESGRLDVLDLDITKRETAWCLLIGFTINWMAFTSVNQTCLQKFLSVPTLRKSKISAVLYLCGISILELIAVLFGLVLYAKYDGCDPLENNNIQKRDQILTYFILDVTHGIPGLSGLYVAGVFSTVLSTLSANINCLAGTLYEDFLKDFFDKLGYRNTAFIIKSLVVLCGVACTSIVYVFVNVQNVLPVMFTLVSIPFGPLIGIFVLGLLFPKANGKGAFYGTIIGVAYMVILSIGTTYYKINGMIVYSTKLLSVEKCENKANTTMPTLNQVNEESESQYIFPLFKISHYWYTFTGFLVVLVSGIIISYLTRKKTDESTPKELLSPVIHFLVKKDKMEDKMLVDYPEQQETLLHRRRKSSIEFRKSNKY